jgi:hypothetical protein
MATEGTDGTDGTDEPILVNNGARSLTLDELGRSQPGMGRLMPEVGNRIWRLWYAAEARNWDLARYQLEEGVAVMELSAFVRPKYARAMATFLGAEGEAVKAAIEAKDWDAFRAAYDQMVERANAYHEQFNKGFIRWKRPDMPPPDLDLAPRQ